MKRQIAIKEFENQTFDPCSDLELIVLILFLTKNTRKYLIIYYGLSVSVFATMVVCIEGFLAL